MSQSNFINIDHMAAENAQQLIQCTSGENKSTVDAMITKALGVIQEDGVYAGALFLCSRSKSDKKIADSVMESIINFIAQLGKAMKFNWGDAPKAAESPDTIFKFMTDYVTIDLQKLLMIREALERMMIYARYGIKSRNK